jgi:hypothetical protein
MTTSCPVRPQALSRAVQGSQVANTGHAAPAATESTPTLRLGRRALACRTDCRIEENVMARKKDKKAQSAQGAPAAV